MIIFGKQLFCLLSTLASKGINEALVNTAVGKHELIVRVPIRTNCWSCSVVIDGRGNGRREAEQT